MKNRILMGDSYHAGHNLAVEALIFDTLPEDTCIFYLWQNRNTVVIGRHQNAWKECRLRLLEKEGGYLARRSSGGGAVFHDLGNLNFTFLMPRANYDVHRQLSVIRRAVAEFGIDTAFTGRNDLVIVDSGAKFSGNAFRFSERVGMHHGTIMVDVDVQKLGRYLAPGREKLRAKGIESVRSRVGNLSACNSQATIPAVQAALRRAFMAEYGPATEMTMSELPQDRLAEYEREYDSWDFRLGKALPFDVTLETRFEWGGITLELSLKNGEVSQANVFSDAMDEAMVAAVGPCLNGVRYENSALASAVSALEYPQARELAQWLSSLDL